MLCRELKYIYLTLLCMILSCSTEVDICVDDSHLHLSEVELFYDLSDFSGITKEEFPDSMIIIAYRVINSWKCTYISPITEDFSYGRYLYNKPYEEDTSASEKQDEHFFVKKGEYRFIAFNNLINNEVYEDNVKYRWYEIPKVIDSVVTNKDIYVYYKSYNIKKELLEKYGRDWVDFNPYSTYISRKKAPMFFQYSDAYTIDNTKKNIINLNFKEITQEIEIRFSIEHDSVCIDSMVAEVSGIPCGMNLMTGKYDLSKTYKTLIDMKALNRPINKWNGVTEFSGSIEVMGLAANSSKRQNTGTGIMQLAIFTHTLNNKGEKKRKVFHVGINMYNAINEYAAVIGKFDEKVILDIQNVLSIKKDEILENNEYGSTLDDWTVYENINVDI